VVDVAGISYAVNKDHPSQVGGIDATTESRHLVLGLDAQAGVLTLRSLRSALSMIRIGTVPFGQVWSAVSARLD
jgi:hypothetical protein